MAAAETPCSMLLFAVSVLVCGPAATIRTRNKRTAP